MQCNSSSHWFRAIFFLMITAFLAACGDGDGEDVVEDSAADQEAQELRLVFEDDFGGSSGSPRTAGRDALPADSKWRAVTGYGPNNDGWFNDEWQLYQNSIDNLYTENGNLVIEARCDTAPTCGKRDDTITSARIMTKDRLEVQYGVIKARIKVPGGVGMWPAFWMLGENWPETNWPFTGEIDIMEMLYDRSDRFTSHFTIHWADDDNNDAQTNVSSTYVSDEPLTEDFHVYEVDWNEERIIGKIDGITYFTKTIDPATMTEFKNEFFLLLNVAVGGAGGDPTTDTDWPDQMLVDWVRVFERVPPTSGSLTSETEDRLDFIRIIQSQEFGNANIVNADADNTDVPALEGSETLKVEFTGTRTGLPGGPVADYSGAFYSFSGSNLSNFTNFNLSIDTSEFPGFDNLTIEFKDLSETLVQVKLADYTPVSTSGNWKTYNIPLSAFAGVDLGSILFIGFLDAVNEADYTGITTFGSGSSFDDDFSGDSSFSNALEVSVGGGYGGGALAQLGLEGFAAGFAAGYDELVFKAKGLTADNTILVKLEEPFPGTSVPVTVDLASPGANIAVTDIGDGWSQVVIQLSAYGDVSTFSQVVFQTLDGAYAVADKFYLTDIGFNTSGASGSTLPEVALISSDPDNSPVDLSSNDLLAGTIYLDDLRFSTQACTPAGTVEFDSIDYNPATNVAQVTVSDECKANELVTVKVENGDNEEITLGVDLDSGGDGSTIFGLIDPLSVCSTSDEFGYITLSPSLMATYMNSEGGVDYMDTATAGVDAGAPGTSLTANEKYFYATDPDQTLTFRPDANFEYSVFGSGSTLEGAFADSTYNPVFSVTSGNGYGANNQTAQIVYFRVGNGFADDSESINFKIKNLHANSVTVGFGVEGGATDSITIDVTTYAGSTPDTDGWYNVSIPMSEFPNTAGYNFLTLLSGADSISQFTFLITDVFLSDPVGNVPAECALAPLDPVVFDDDYGNGVSFVAFGGSTNSISIVTTEKYSGTSSLQIEVPASGYTGGALAVSPGRNVSSYDELTFWAKASQAATLNTAGVANNGAGDAANQTEVSNLALTTDWQQFTITPTDPLVLTANTGLFHFAENDAEGAYTIWIDEIQYGDDPVVFADNFGSGVSFVPFGGSINDVTVVTSEQNSGTSSLQVVVPAAGYTGGALAVSPGRDVSMYDQLSFYAKASQAATLNTAGVANNGAGDAANQTELLGVVSLTTSWQEFTITPADPSLLTANTGLFHFAENDAEGAYTIWFDDINYIDTPASGGAPNLLTNGGFETGDLTGWLDPAPGAGSLTVTNSESNGGTWSARAQVGVSQNVFAQQNGVGAGTLSDGDTIEVSFDLKGDLNAGGVVNTLVNWASGGASGVLAPNITSSVADWTNYSYTYTLSGGDLTGGVSLLIETVCGGGAGCVGDVYIDNVSVTVQ